MHDNGGKVQIQNSIVTYGYFLDLPRWHKPVVLLEDPFSMRKDWNVGGSQQREREREH